MELFDYPDNLIPRMMIEIADNCGQTVALALLMNYPGVHVRIPKTPTMTHKLAELLGVDAFKKLCEIYGNEVIQIPRAAAAIRELRNQNILRDFASGMMQSSIALQYGITERQVNRICNNVQLCNQQDIFDG